MYALNKSNDKINVRIIHLINIMFYKILIMLNLYGAAYIFYE